MKRIFITAVLIGIMSQVSNNAYANPIFDRAVQATVQIVTLKEGTDEVQSRASGIIVNELGWVLTNRHVVFDGSKYRDILIIPTGRNEQPDMSCSYRVEAGGMILGINGDDTALIIPDKDDVQCTMRAYLPPLKNDLATGENVVVLGYPGLDIGGETLTVTNGKIAGRVLVGGNLQYLKIDAQIGPGSSGGPVIDDDGRLIGIAAAATQIKHSNGLIQELVGLIIPSSKIVASFPEIEEQAEGGRSPDVSPNAWFAQAVEHFTEKGYIAPERKYRPGDRATRAEFIDLVIQLLGGVKNGPFSKQSFTDVPRGSVLYETFEEAGKRGLVKGSGNCYGSLRCSAKPTAPINRAEAATLLLRAFDIKALPRAPRFRDNPAGQWFTDSIKAAASLCILRGDDGAKTVRPGDLMNRAEMIVMLLRLHEKLSYPKCISTASAPDIPFAPGSSAQPTIRGHTPPPPPPPSTMRGDVLPCTAKAWECIINSYCSRKKGTQTQTCSLQDRTCNNPNRAKPPTVIKCNPLEGQLRNMITIINDGETLLDVMAEQILTITPSNFQSAQQARQEYEAKLNDYKGHLDGIYKYSNYLQLFREAITQTEKELEAAENRFFGVPGTVRPTQ